MLKQNKGKLILSSLLILLPALAGVLLWDELPMQMTTHWGLDGAADGWSGRPFAVFGLPLFLLAFHWLCLWITARDKGNKNQSGKVFGLVFWIMPLTSILTSGIVYLTAFGKEFDADTVMLLFLGVMFMVIGNYLPKTRQNRTIGIKIKWTLQNEENWNATHRVGGRLWVLGGLLFMLCIFLPKSVIPWVLLIGMIVLAVIPIAYSYWYHRRQVREGTAVEISLPKTKFEKYVFRITMFFVAAILAFCVFICFTGDIEVAYGEDTFTVEASYWDDLTVAYDVIDAVEYHADFNKGARTFGFGTPRLSIGSFQNDECGAYTLYAYTNCDAAVVLTADGGVLVLSGRDAESTRAIYEELLNR